MISSAGSAAKTIAVDCYLRHCTDRNIARSDQEWLAHHLIRLVKGENLGPKTFFEFTVGGVRRRIDASNSAAAFNELIRLMAERIRLSFGTNVVVVPVPNSDAIAGSGSFNTLQHATRIAAGIGAPANASDLLRWKVRQGRAHENGRERNYQEHYEQLAIPKKTGGRIVLYDDVVTSGAQMFASRKRLTDSGMNVVGCLAFAEVIDHGTRGNDPGWQTANRTMRTNLFNF